MDVIACKKGGVGVMYLLCTFVGLIISASGFAMMGEGIIMGIAGIAIALISGYVFFSYVSLPYAVIQLDSDNNLHLPKNLVVNVGDVLDVSYRRASARGIQYRWGSVTLSTRLGTYRYGYIADCESVAKSLTDMIYQAKYKKAD